MPEIKMKIYNENSNPQNKALMSKKPGSDHRLTFLDSNKVSFYSVTKPASLKLIDFKIMNSFDSCSTVSDLYIFNKSSRHSRQDRKSVVVQMQNREH